MHIFWRKLIATYFTAFMIGLFFGFLFTLDFDTDRGWSFYGMTLIVLFYGGLVILVYGNATSLLSEYINKRWFQNHTLPFIIIHLLFGALFGAYYVIYNEYSVLTLGICGAFIYALTDRLLYKQKESNKLALWFLFSPPAVFLLCIVAFWVLN